MRVLLLALLVSSAVQAADMGGRIRLDASGYDAGTDSIDADLGYRQSSELNGQLRLELNQDMQPWAFHLAWQLDARHGSAVERDHDIALAYPLLADSDSDTSLWKLDDVIDDDGSDYSRQRLDRLNLEYAHDALVLRLGRQALTWGSGLVFHPMDLVNPFQPVATDTAYKRGTDMAYLQWLLEDGSDIQLVAVPHSQRDSSDPDADKTTSAIYMNLIGDELQWSLLVARDRADNVFGVGVSGPWGGSVWNMEIIPAYLEQQSTRTSLLMNLSHAGVFLERNITSFAEYYHNGFGESGDDYTLEELNNALLTRLQRGEVFVTGQDYLAAGINWEWTPLLQLVPTLIVNLQDNSSLLDMQFNRSLGNNLALKGGLRVSTGTRGSEFGGLELLQDSGLYLAAGNQVFISVENYF